MKETKANGKAKGQASLELLIIVAASFAFFALLAPQITASHQKISAYAMEQAQKQTAQQIASTASKASALSPGSRLYANIFIPTQTQVQYDYYESKIELVFSQSHKENQTQTQVFAPAPFYTNMPETFLEKGSYNVWAENTGFGEVKITFEKKQARLE